MRRTIAIAGCMALLWAGSAQAAGYEPDQVIVKYADGASQAQRMKVAHRAGVTRSLGSIAGVAAKVVRVRRDPAVVAARLNRSRVVEYAEPNLIVRAAWFPNDPRFGGCTGFTTRPMPTSTRRRAGRRPAWGAGRRTAA